MRVGPPKKKIGLKCIYCEFFISFSHKNISDVTAPLLSHSFSTWFLRRLRHLSFREIIFSIPCWYQIHVLCYRPNSYTCSHVAIISEFLAVNSWPLKTDVKSLGEKFPPPPPDKIAISAGFLVTKIYAMNICVLADSIRNVSWSSAAQNCGKSVSQWVSWERVRYIVCLCSILVS
jgi:hypothetical protein